MTVMKHPTGPIPSVSGQSGNLLSTNGSELTWFTPSAVEGMTVIASGSLTGNSVSLTSIVNTYKDLTLVLRNLSTNNNANVGFRINNVTGSNYWRMGVGGSNSVAANGNTADDRVNITPVALQNTTTNNTFIITFHDYTNSSNKSGTLECIYTDNTTVTHCFSGGWGCNNVLSAITQIDILNNGSPTFDNGTYILYGVK
jgi:hypothetical protein